MRQRSETTRQEIIVAAHKLFLDHGFSATSMDDIAAEAGMAKQTLYGYFSDKRALFTAVIEHAVGTPWKLELTDAITSREQLAQALYTVLSGLNAVSMRPKYIKLLRVIVSEATRHPEIGDLFRNGVTYRSLQSLSALFAASNKAGVTDIANPELAACFFLGGMVIRIFLDGLLTSPSVVSKLAEQELQEYVDMFVAFVIPHNKRGS